MSLSVKLEKRFSLVTMSDKAVFFNCQCLDMILYFCYKTKWIKRKNMLVDTEEVTFIHLFYATHESSRISVQMSIPVLAFELILMSLLLLFH